MQKQQTACSIILDVILAIISVLTFTTTIILYIIKIVYVIHIQYGIILKFNEVDERRNKNKYLQFYLFTF
jgi:hypothetical protein